MAKGAVKRFCCLYTWLWITNCTSPVKVRFVSEGCWGSLRTVVLQIILLMRSVSVNILIQYHASYHGSTNAGSQLIICDNFLPFAPNMDCYARLKRRWTSFLTITHNWIFSSQNKLCQPHLEIEVLRCVHYADLLTWWYLHHYHCVWFCTALSHWQKDGEGSVLFQVNRWLREWITMVTK